MNVTFGAYYTLIMAVLVLLLGKFMTRHIRFLRDFNIPEPVSGGLVVAATIFALHQITGLTVSFEGSLQSAFMLVFFSSIGLSANFTKLREGGSALFVFLGVIAVFIVVQNAVGVGLAKVLGLDPLIGLVAGSITLVGGHGTAGAWGSVLESEYGLTGATTLGIACATFGLVIGGLLGGPLAKRLITKNQLASPRTEDEQLSPSASTVPEGNEVANFESPSKAPRLITADAAVETLALFAGCLAFAEFMTGVTKGTAIQLPTFVWALGGGVVIRNALDYIFGIKVFDRAIDVFGNAALSIYLAIALLSLKLWELTDLAGPLMIILAAQTVMMALYAALVTFRIMGKNYDAAVLAAGHCGFGMGATPTAVANMQAITNQYGPSHKAFLIVPLVGAFFIDIINAFALQGFISVLR
ncbi:sodium/glutamate symporter [Comamonas resistens]|uniref:Sodium/glutamate symporter n=1 Tax=Comamonas resistens TaxID=3046670 RepID=A0ABY8SWP0_9BURK|nr:sodium/glutamate symporter [Comamonas resistens]MDL5037108.1 sodium/glutamate symporter [Comamonas resistens]WHS65691.1 sodium/glutamate symporter [Comamonas resistens]